MKYGLLQPGIVFMLLLLLSPKELHAQDTLTAQLFFSRALGTVSSTTPMPKSVVKFPLIEEYDLRTETRDFDLEKQEYTFRVHPTSTRMRRAQADMLQHLNSRPDFAAQKDYCERKLDANRDWLDLYYWQTNQALLTELAVIYQDRQTLFTSEINTLQVSSKDLIDQRIQTSNLALAKFESDNEVSYLLDKYDFNPTGFSFNNFLPVDQIALRLNGVPVANVKPPPKTVYDLAMIEKELALEEAEKGQLFDFAQIRYRGPHADDWQERFSIGAAMSLSNSGNRKLKMEELKLERHRLENEVIQEAQGIVAEVSDIELKLQKQVAYYEFYAQTIFEEAAYLDQLAENLLRSATLNPLRILDIKERQIRNQMEQLQLARDIYERYLDWEFEAGNVCTETSLNLLER